MEHNTTETDTSGTTDTSDGADGEELPVEIRRDDVMNSIKYVQQHPHSTNAQLFSFLALLNAYVPKSYLRMRECQRVLGPPDPIHGGPPFEERMRPFAALINTSSPDEICIINRESAQKIVDELATLKITRSTTVKKFMSLLCGNPPEYVIKFIRVLLIKRSFRKKDKFSALIEDILKEENFDDAVSVLTTASDKFSQDSLFPQTVSRLYYIVRGVCNYDRAEEWAKEAITRDPDNSYVADTLGHIYKNRLKREDCDFIEMAKKAFEAFKDVEKKADKEESPQMEDPESTARVSASFNNRGLFGFIQVAKIAHKKLKGNVPADIHPNLEMEVKARFDFFEWYLTYCQISKTISEPHYVWGDVARCYEDYTKQRAAESTSFPGLLDLLNHDLFTAKGRHAGFFEAEKSVSAFETTRDGLRTEFEKNADDVKVAERYILSNILLSNKRPDSPQLTPVTELQEILHRFLGAQAGFQRPEFYLLVLLLFWPEEQLQVTQEEDDEVNPVVTAEDRPEISQDEDTEEENAREGEPAQQSVKTDPDLEQCVTFMEEAFKRENYAKYLRGRYLLPLFFLGKGSGLSRWIHKSRLDAIVEAKVDTELADEHHEIDKEKMRRINALWLSGEVWHIPQIKDILLPVHVEPRQRSMGPQEHREQEVFVCAGGKKIKARIEATADASGQTRYYLGFTIQGPVVFEVEDSDCQ